MRSCLTPLELLARSASVYRDQIAAIEGPRRITYAEFHERVHRLGSALRRLGVGPGDRVAVLAPNNLAALEAHFGPMLIGAVLVMLNTRLQTQELAWILNHCGAKVLIADPQLLDAIQPARAGLPTVQHIVSDYERFLATGDLPLADLPEPEEDGLICINYTSGTTGFPKGVMFTHRGAWLNAVGEIVEQGLSSRSVYLWTLPMFHCNGWCFPWAITGVGGCHILLRQVDAQEAVRLIVEEGVTHLCGAPVVVATLTRYCASLGIRFTNGLKIITAGAPPAPAVIRAAEETGADLAHLYGLTETYGPHTICAWKSQWDSLDANARAQIKARQGVPFLIAGTGLRVVDVHMADVPPDGQTMGEVIMRGNNVMLGYYNNVKATEEAFAGGWFHSGDLAVMHPDGYIELRDRAKDIVISGGENISSIEVEKVIADHPAVSEVAIVAWPDEKWGEVPRAFVGLKPGAAVTAAELIEWCRARLAHFKCPKHVEFTTLPRTATGKIRKNELRGQGQA
ncbi:MAG TPA: AMP-binding protein [Bryobacteraceae bacterium]|nr:AMP-binding protein [Bryobacteraceae bacterium]